MAPENFHISNQEFYNRSKFEKSTVYAIRLQSYEEIKVRFYDKCLEFLLFKEMFYVDSL